jgi:PepSY-associated TM region
MPKMPPIVAKSGRPTSIKATAWRWLIVGHRWLGIATCLFFAVWFASGLVMMYVAFPELTREERVSRLLRIDWSEVQIAPERVLHGLALGEFPRDFRLEMMAGEPVYRVEVQGSPRQTVSAATGRIIGQVDEQRALAIVRSSTSATRATVATIERDQWSVAGTFEGHRPLHRVALNDAAGEELYVSSRTGEIVLDSTARERGWNWVGAVVHWLYFRDLRANPPLWSQIVMWISGVGIVVALTGLWLGIDRRRQRADIASGRILCECAPRDG